MRCYISILSTLLVCSSMGSSRADETFANRVPRYRIQPADVIEVQYRYTPEYNHTVTVQPDGFVALQFVGDVKVSGLTVEEAAAIIQSRAGERLQKPEVAVTLKEFVKPYFTVAGEVSKPGRFDFRGGLNAIEGIAIAGGFKESSQRSQVILLRQIGPDQAEVKVLDVKKLMHASNIRESTALQAGDLLVVPQNRVSRIEPLMRLGSSGLYGLGLALRGY